MPSSTAPVFEIPPEVTEHALTFLHPRDIANFSKTCHLGHGMVYGGADQYLWRQLFLAYPFDDPRKTHNFRQANVSYNWKGELQRRVQTELIASNIEQRLDEQNFALETVVSAILDAPPVQSGGDHRHSESLKWVTRILRDSRILDAPGVVANQLVSRIRTYLALSLDGNTNAQLDSLRTRGRCQVYDLRNYRLDNHYGPFLCGGQIDWVHAEDIVNIVQMNLMQLQGVWRDIKPPVGLESTRAYSVTGAANRATGDWACVEGTWKRYVCFLDYRYVFPTLCYISLSAYAELTAFSDLFGGSNNLIQVLIL